MPCGENSQHSTLRSDCAASLPVRVRVPLNLCACLEMLHDVHKSFLSGWRLCFPLVFAHPRFGGRLHHLPTIFTLGFVLHIKAKCRVD